VAGSTWRTIMQRSKEAELLFRGDQYRRAIESYFKSAHGGRAGQLPTELDNLLRDPRSPDARRHIRRLFLDPMTGEEFEPIREAGGTIGRIRGVRSKSELEPFKKDGFAKEYDKFKDATSYQSWEFVYEPPKQPGKPKVPSAATPPGGASPSILQPVNPLAPQPSNPTR